MTYICTICRFETEADDIVVRFVSGKVLCLSCYERETLTAIPMPAGLRRAVLAAMAGT